MLSDFSFSLSHLHFNVRSALFGTSVPIWKQNDLKKDFHLWSSEILASAHGHSSLDGPNRPCMLACISEDQRWKKFLVLISPSDRCGGYKSALPQLFHSIRVRAANQPHDWSRLYIWSKPIKIYCFGILDTICALKFWHLENLIFYYLRQYIN